MKKMLSEQASSFDSLYCQHMTLWLLTFILYSKFSLFPFYMKRTPYCTIMLYIKQ